MPREPADRRKSSFGSRRGPPRQHIPFRADDLARGKKTGMAVAYVDRNSDEFEPFEQVIKQADSRSPPRIKSKKKRVSVAPPVAEIDEDGEMSMDLAESEQWCISGVYKLMFRVLQAIRGVPWLTLRMQAPCMLPIARGDLVFPVPLCACLKSIMIRFLHQSRISPCDRRRMAEVHRLSQSRLSLRSQPRNPNSVTQTQGRLMTLNLRNPTRVHPGHELLKPVRRLQKRTKRLLERTKRRQEREKKSQKWNKQLHGRAGLTRASGERIQWKKMNNQIMNRTMRTGSKMT